jgi:hypothetical protein
MRSRRRRGVLTPPHNSKAIGTIIVNEEGDNFFGKVHRKQQEPRDQPRCSIPFPEDVVESPDSADCGGGGQPNERDDFWGLQPFLLSAANQMDFLLSLGEDSIRFGEYFLLGGCLQIANHNTPHNLSQKQQSEAPAPAPAAAAPAPSEAPKSAGTIQTQDA